MFSRLCLLLTGGAVAFTDGGGLVPWQGPDPATATDALWSPRDPATIVGPRRPVAAVIDV